MEIFEVGCSTYVGIGDEVYRIEGERLVRLPKTEPPPEPQEEN